MSIELTPDEYLNLQLRISDTNRRATSHPFSYTEEQELDVVKLVDEGLSNAEIHRRTRMSIDRINDCKKKFKRWGK